MDGLTTGFNFVLRDKARRKSTTLTPKLELGLPTLCCPSNPYGSNSKSCAVHRFDVLVPVPVSFLGRLSEDVATRLSACYLTSLTEAAHRYLDALCNEARHVRNKSFEFGVFGKNGLGGWVGWVKVLKLTQLSPTLSRKRSQAHVKLPSPVYFINRMGLYRPGGLMDRISFSLIEFPRVLASTVFDSCSMNSFCVALTSLFEVSLVIFYFLLAYYFALYSYLIFTSH